MNTTTQNTVELRIGFPVKNCLGFELYVNGEKLDIKLERDEYLCYARSTGKDYNAHL